MWKMFFKKWYCPKCKSYRSLAKKPYTGVSMKSNGGELPVMLHGSIPSCPYCHTPMVDVRKALEEKIEQVCIDADKFYWE